MKEFMVTCTLPDTLSDEFMGLIPAQISRVNELFKEGSLTSYTLAADYSKLWAVFLANDEEEVMDSLVTLPLIRFFKVDVNELLFNNKARIVLPKVSLN